MTTFSNYSWAAVVAVLEVLDQEHLEKAKSMSNYSALR